MIGVRGLARLCRVTDSAKPTLLVVDGHSLAYRAFYALPVDNFSTKDGQYTNGIYGFLAMLINLIKAEKPTHMARGVRHLATVLPRRRVPRSTRRTAPRRRAEFKGQIPLLQDCLAAMSITVLQKEDIEADDILATLATPGRRRRASDVLVCSGDRDTIQLVNDDITLLYPNVQGVSQLKRYDRQAVIERYGVPPEQYPDIAALVGETSDNLPGVPKVGEKTAVKWLNQFGSLDALLENADKVTGVVGGNLARAPRRRAAQPGRSTASCTDVELAARPRRPRGAAHGRPGRARHLRRASSSSTLIPRVAETGGHRARQIEAASPSAPQADARPSRQELAAASVGAWLDKSGAGDARPRRREDRRPARAASASRATPRRSSSPGRRMPRATPLHVARLRRPEGTAATPSPRCKALRARRALTPRAASRSTRSLARVAAAPSFPDKTLAGPRGPLSRREAARGRPVAARPRDRGRDARPAVLVHPPRRGGAARRAAGSRLHRARPTIELPTLLGAGRHGARRRRRVARRSCSRILRPSCGSAPTRLARRPAYARSGGR